MIVLGQQAYLSPLPRVYPRKADPNNSKESNALDAPYQEALEKKRRLENPSIPIIVVSIDSRIIQIGSKDPILTYPGHV